MAIKVTRSLLYGNYFLALESDVDHLARYVEPVEGNFGTYSIELARLLLAAASEVDVLAKKLCSKVDKDSNARSIGAYWDVIEPTFGASKGVVGIPRYGMEFRPWENWAKGSPPKWWQANNHAKHRRDEHFKDANLKNALNAMAALFLFELYLHQDEVPNGAMAPPPTLFRPPENLATVGWFFDGGYVLKFTS